ncbi:stage II sporulation protein M [Halovivax limisalsi]|uniref:stage II sporulation protein M n=1 Tax=Halovivax limisalsi TaxID=1453760 RepID=UPI001FFDB0AA|nr:stage II sporulation protein M [Halovivax limisalsi]
MDERSGADGHSDEADPPERDPRSTDTDGVRSQTGSREPLPRVPERSTEAKKSGADAETWIDDASSPVDASDGESGSPTLADALDPETGRIPVDPSLDVDPPSVEGDRRPSGRSELRDALARHRDAGEGAEERASDADRPSPGRRAASLWAALLSLLGVVSFLLAGFLQWRFGSTELFLADGSTRTIPKPAALGAAAIGVAFLSLSVLGVRYRPSITRGLAAAWAETRRYVWFAAALLIGGAVVGAALGAGGYDVLSILQETTGERPPVAGETAGWYLRRNSPPFVLAIAGGVTVGLVTGYLLVVNGLVIGNVAWLAAQQEGVVHVLAGLAPHGLFELAAIAIAAGVGFRLAHRVAGRLRGAERAILPAEALNRSVLLIAVAWLLLALAAIVEAHVTSLLLGS